MFSETRWQQIRTSSFNELQQPQKHEVKTLIPKQFHDAITQAQEFFSGDDFAEIQDGKLKLKRYDKVAVPSDVSALQKVINSRLPHDPTNDLL